MSRSYSKSVIADTAVVTTAETAAITSDPVNQAVDGEPITIRGSLSYLTGASTTAVTVRIREGSGLTGSLVGETLPYTVGAAVSTQIPYEFTYSPSGVAGQRWTASIQATAATANGTIQAAAMTVSLG